ncbi:DUF6283 family protein [Streptacidiphilus sp. EB129]|uniref:DUF6283 family protein n=1 Tax=Streptacidiphilus sp. EB129 TaxID=3156262 RepID=UPI0035177C26
MTWTHPETDRTLAGHPRHNASKSSLRQPAPRPCESCPYRRDVPSGVWAHREYEKLRRYDAPTPEQPSALFQCHQADADSEVRRICAGWAGCHDSTQLLALRIGVLNGSIDEATYHTTVTYQSPVPLFASGCEAADHGQAAIDQPREAAEHLIAKISRVRADLET